MSALANEAPDDKALLGDNDYEETVEDLRSDENCYKRKTRKHAHSCWSPLRIVFVAGTIALALWGLVDIVKQASNAVRLLSSASIEDPCDVCGNTPEEALSRGCKFDYLRTGWLPEFCIDEELHNEFRNAGPANGTWEYFADSAGTRPIPADVVPTIWQEPVYSTYGWHFMHCVYTWRKEYRSFTMRKSILDSNSGERHIMHCAEIFKAKGEFDFHDIVTLFEPKSDEE